jgi:transcriptional regulator with XRE-family HTH domain
MDKISQIVKESETEAFKFKPNPEFYRSIGINRKRWAQLYRGEKEPTVPELQRIAKYFDTPISELLKEKEHE